MNDDTDTNVQPEALGNDTNDSLDIETDESELMLSTVDNPFNPKTQYDEWKQFDNDNGYYTEEYIARLINMESDYDADDEFMLNIITSRVIDDILENDDLELYVLV